MARIVHTDRAPEPVGPYSQGVIVGCFLFVSGQVPLDPRTGRIVEGGFEDRVRRALENVKAVVEAAGASLSDVVKVTAYLTDLRLFPDFNRVYSEYFPESPPARVTIGVAQLPAGADIELEAVAYLCKE